MPRSIVRKFPGLIVLAVVAGLTGACAGNDPLNLRDPDLTLSVAPSDLQLRRGDTGTVTLTANRMDFVGPVDILVRVTSPPVVGVAVTVGPSIPSGQQTIEIQVTADSSSAPLGTIEVTVEAATVGTVSDGSVVKTTTFSVTISE